jgi:hypothetical protein
VRENHFIDKEPEKYRAVRQDGLDDIFQGIALALMAPFFLDRGYVWAFLLGIAIRSCHPGGAILRRGFTLPRLGCGGSALPRESGRIVTAAVASLPWLLLWVIDPPGSAGVGSRFGWILPLYCAAALTAPALVQALRYGDPFGYIHAALFLEGGFVGLFLILFDLGAGKATALQLWGLAAILLLIGLVRLIRFGRVHPGPAQEVFHGEE